MLRSWLWKLWNKRREKKQAELAILRAKSQQQNIMRALGIEEVASLSRPQEGKHQCEERGCANSADVLCDYCSGPRCSQHSWAIMLRTAGSRPSKPQYVYCWSDTKRMESYIHAKPREGSFGPQEYLTIQHRATGNLLVNDVQLWQG